MGIVLRPFVDSPIVASAPAPAHLAATAARVDARIQALLNSEIARWSAVNPQLMAPLRSLQALVMAGGKRLRPAFCYWAFVGAGGHPEDPLVIDAGAGLELLHTFALVHDDVMDGSATRRGMDAVHVQFINTHEAAQRRGEARRFGEGVAILVGDLAFVYADLLLVGAPRSAIDIFTELRVEVNIGQYLDLVGTATGNPTLEAARQIGVYKSGKYTVERPLHLGAALAGQFERHDTALTRFGIPLGEAFQLRDDLLGALGDDGLTGKPVGDDLREGKPTALLAHALASCTANQAEILGTVGDPELDDDRVRAIQEVLRATGAEGIVERQISTLRDDSIAAIESSALSRPAINALVELAFFVTDRNH